jgi:hypothetical protein
MITLNEAQNVVAKLCPDFISFVCNDLVLTEWANKGVISGMEIRDENALYPKIIVMEILTAINLKKQYNYNLQEIAEARKYLNLNKKIMAGAEENNLLNLINLKRVYNDKKIVIKKVIERINSIEKIKNIIDDLYQENEKLERMVNYCFECFKAKKEIQNSNPGFIS